jgi:hypothetical protein
MDKVKRSICDCFGWRQTRQQRSEHLSVVPAIVPKRKSVNIRLEILPANAVVRPINAPLNLNPKTLDGIRVGSASDTFSRTVVY